MYILHCRVPRPTRELLAKNNVRLQARDMVTKNPDLIAEFAQLYPFEAILIFTEDCAWKEIIGKVRQKKVRIPIVGLGIPRLGFQSLKAEFLTVGGDDLIVHPPFKDELLAVLRAVIRRPQGFVCDVIEFEFNNFTFALNRAACTLTCNDTEVELTAADYATLDLLISLRGAICSRNLACYRLFDNRDNAENDRLIDTRIKRLRQSLRVVDPSLDGLIKAHYSNGYRFAGVFKK